MSTIRDTAGHWRALTWLGLSTATVLAAVACKASHDDGVQTPSGTGASHEPGGGAAGSGSALSSAGAGQQASSGTTAVVPELVLRVDENGVILQSDGVTVNGSLGVGSALLDGALAIDLSNLPAGATSLKIETLSRHALELTGVPAIPLKIATTGDITLVTSGDTLVESIRSSEGNVTIRSAGTVRDVAPEAESDGTTPRIVGTVLSIDATLGIGSAEDSLEVDSACSASQGAVRFKARDAIFVTETRGDLCVAAVVSLKADVGLTVRDGSILEAAGNERASVQGGSLDLAAPGGGIGTVDAPLKLYGAGTRQSNNVLQIEPNIPHEGHLFVSARDSIHIRQVNGALRVLQATSDTGAIRIANFDTVIGDEDFDLVLDGRTLHGAPLSGRVSARLGVDIAEFDRILIPVGTVVESDTEIRIGGDPADDIEGVNIDLRGSVDAPELLLVGGPGIDYLQLDDANGINARGHTTLSGEDGSDYVFVRAAPGPLAILCGTGADRVFLASNANRALFSAPGYFTENVPALNLLSGTLDRFGDVTIDTGEGGNGGTRDAIYISADLDASGLVGAVSGSTISGLGLAGTIRYSGAIGSILLLELGSNVDTLTVTNPSPHEVHILKHSVGDKIAGCDSPYCSVDDT